MFKKFVRWIAAARQHNAGIDQFIAELQALRQRLQHEATLVEREVVHYANLTEAARASMRTIWESLSWQKQ